MDARPASFSLTKHTLGLILLLLFTALILTGCKMEPTEEFIQGQWYDNNDHLSNLPGESPQESYWYFGNKTFETYGCCFTEWAFSGNYRVLESSENEIILELYQLKGSSGSTALHSDDTGMLEIDINWEDDTISIGSDPFTRVSRGP